MAAIFPRAVEEIRSPLILIISSLWFCYNFLYFDNTPTHIQEHKSDSRITVGIGNKYVAMVCNFHNGATRYGI